MAQILRKSMMLDGIAASEAIDSSGEVLSIKGLDITSLQDGTGVLNYEHRGDQSEGASSNDVIGAITFAKKIFSEKDCDNEREKSYWSKIKLPFVYIQAELFNDEGHPGAVAAAALIRYYQRRKLPILMRYSIEGSTLDRDGNVLKRAIAKRVAATLKPCNRSCVSGVINDSEEKEKSPDALESLVRFENPNREKLGGFEGEFNPIVSDSMGQLREAIADLHEINDLNKALAIGGGDARPSTMQGGGALQAESFDGEKKKRFIKNQALAALRDWRGRGDLTKFLKHRMPDASDSFIDHFSRLVDEFHLKKMSELETNLIKAVTAKNIGPSTEAQPTVTGGKKMPKSEPAQTTKKPTIAEHKAKVTAAHAEDVEDLPEEALGDEPLTFRGRKVRPTNATGSKFDERTGILHTPRGNFKMYLPQEDKHDRGALESFNNIMNDPKATKFHDYAVSNWLKVHKMLKNGTLPPEIIMHSTLFSQLSPNTPVPMQELMYAHLVDSMRAKGVDARSPQFQQLKEDWLSRDKPQTLPETATEHFVSGGGKGVRLKMQSKLTGRSPGDIGGFMLANNKFKSMEQYHSLHSSLVDLFGRHGADARSAVSELMGHKHQANLHEAARQRHIEQGKPDPGPYTAGPAVPGLAPKTGRYMAAMIGGGNVHVPDTHFTRYLFGLEKGTDARTIAYLKNVLWARQNSHVLDGIDRFYANNHPAVQHMLQHPMFGKHFSDHEDAIFPAFWKNWMAIAPHERARGMKTMAYNESTDHRPFWEAISPYLDHDMTKGEMPLDLPLRTARLHAQWVEKYGEVPAQMLYFAHIVPQLLRASRRNEDVMVKMERIASELKKAAAEMEPQLPPLKHEAPQKAQEFRGRKIIPGEIELTSGPFEGSTMHFLGSAHGSHFVRPKEGGDISLLNQDGEGMHYRILSGPQEYAPKALVDANLHSDPNMNKRHSQKSLIHGIDMLGQREVGTSGATAAELGSKTGWYKNHANVKGYVKPDAISIFPWTDPDPEYEKEQNSYGTHSREVLFHNMANDFFGLGQHVPVTATFKHPQTGEDYSVQEQVRGAHHFEHDDDDDEFMLDREHKNGNLDKLSLMDLLMGNSDRNPGNYMISNKGLHLIDNGLALSYSQPNWGGSIWEHHGDSAPDNVPSYSRPIHPASVDWLLSHDPTQFHQQLVAHGVPPIMAKEGFDVMNSMQLQAMRARQAGKEPTRWEMIQAANNVGKYRQARMNDEAGRLQNL